MPIENDEKHHNRLSEAPSCLALDGNDSKNTVRSLAPLFHDLLLLPFLKVISSYINSLA